MIFLQFQVFPTPPVIFIFDFFLPLDFLLNLNFALLWVLSPTSPAASVSLSFLLLISVEPSLGLRCTATIIISSGPVCTQTVMFLKGLSARKITGIPGTGRWSLIEASLQLTREKSRTRGKKRKSGLLKRTPFHLLWVYSLSVSFECRDKSILFE